MQIKLVIECPDCGGKNNKCQSCQGTGEIITTLKYPVWKRMEVEVPLKTLNGVVVESSNKNILDYKAVNYKATYYSKES